jgi:hypothetical protein
MTLVLILRIANMRFIFKEQKKEAISTLSTETAHASATPFKVLQFRTVFPGCILLRLP